MKPIISSKKLVVPHSLPFTRKSILLLLPSIPTNRDTSMFDPATKTVHRKITIGSIDIGNFTGKNLIGRKLMRRSRLTTKVCGNIGTSKVSKNDILGSSAKSINHILGCGAKSINTKKYQKVTFWIWSVIVAQK